LSAGADFVFLINADAFVSENTIARLTAASLGESRIGLVGPAVISYYDRTKVYCGGRVDLGLVQPYEELDAHHDSLFDTDYVPGCAVLASSAVARQIGPLDRAYVSYWEDTDWSMRCRLAGFRTVIEPNAAVLHKGTLDRVQNKSDFASYLYTRNRFLFASKFKPRAEMPAFARVYTRDVTKQLVQMERSEPEKMDAVINGWWAGITRRYGSQFVSAPEIVREFFKRKPRRFLELMYPVDTLRARVPVRSTLRRMRGKF
jgi:GT2 family glycosyltransferase